MPPPPEQSYDEPHLPCPLLPWPLQEYDEPQEPLPPEQAYDELHFPEATDAACDNDSFEPKNSPAPNASDEPSKRFRKSRLPSFSGI